MKDQHTVATAYGDVDVELVRCDYCGVKTKEDDAIGVIAPARLKSRWSGVRITGHESGNYCPACADEIFNTSRSHGAVPSSTLEILSWRLSELDDLPFILLFGFAAGVVGAFVGLFGAAVLHDIITFIVGLL